MSYRIGFGYDLHQLVTDRPLILGGIKIPFEKGLKGHSDADVLLHAITDAMLGALALGDIGTHFPDTSDEFKDIDSRIILKKAEKFVTDKHFRIVNIDSTIIAEAPKLLQHIPEIRNSIAKLLQLEIHRVSVKATTNEKMGYLGRNEAIAVHAVVLLSHENNKTSKGTDSD